MCIKAAAVGNVMMMMSFYYGYNGEMKRCETLFKLLSSSFRIPRAVCRVSTLMKNGRRRRRPVKRVVGVCVSSSSSSSSSSSRRGKGVV